MKSGIKRATALLAAFILICQMVVFFPGSEYMLTAHALDDTDETVTSGECGKTDADNVKWELKDGVLTISGEGEMQDYKVYSDHAPWGSWVDLDIVKSIKKIVVEEGVTSIGNASFYQFDYVTNVTLPEESLLRIGDNAFQHCIALGNIEIPATVTYIGSYAFNNCRAFSTIVIPASVEEIGEQAFTITSQNELVTIRVDSANAAYDSRNNCNAIIRKSDDALLVGCKNTTIPGDVKSIGNSAFNGAEDLGSVTIPDGVTAIGESAFENCKNLKSIRIPAGVSRIEDRTFFLCWGLESVTLPDNLDYLGAYAFSLCEELTTITIPNGVTTLKEYLFASCYKLTSVTIPKSVTTIENEAFFNVALGHEGTAPVYGKLLNIYYAGTKAEWDSIVIGYGSDYEYNKALQNATIHCSDGSIGPSHPNEPEVPEEPVESAPTSTTATYGKKGSYTIEYDPESFNNSSYEYNHNIARFAMSLALGAYDELNMRRALVERLKFDDYKEFTPEGKYDGSKSPYSFTHRRMKIGGETCELVLVAIRGTYHEEWMSDFDSGKGVNHSSFSGAADYISDKLEVYLQKQAVDFDYNAKVKFLVTGHSRGAAVANLIGKKLDNGDCCNNYVKSSNDVFVYTFATPNVTRDGNRSFDKYRNIFNIVNPEDFVTKVVPSYWGYGRYGITYVLPSRTTDTTSAGNYVYYDGYLQSLQTYSRALGTDNVYKPYPNGMKEISTYVSKVTSVVKNVDQYYDKDLLIRIPLNNPLRNANLHDLYKYSLGGLLSTNKGYELLSYKVMLDAYQGSYGLTGLETILFFLMNEGTNIEIPKTGITLRGTHYFARAHTPETYYGAMMTLSEAELKQNRKMLKGIVNCPVDVTVTDENGDIVGQITDNTVDESIDGISMYVDGDSKTFYLPQEAGYDVTLTGNDEGTMDYSLCEVDPDIGETARVLYEDVSISKNEELSQSIPAESTVDEVTLYDSSSSAVEAAYPEQGALSVEVTVEGVGSAESVYNATAGDYITLEAVTDANNEFLGWYSPEGDLVSTEVKHSFSIHKNEAFTAKFTNNIVEPEKLEWEKDSVEMTTGEQQYVSVGVYPENATFTNLEYETSDAEVVTVEQGVLTAVKPGTAVITAKAANGITAELNVTVTEPVSLKDISGASIRLEYTTATYTGSNIKPWVTYAVKDNIELHQFKDYLVTYWFNDSVGKATVLVHGIGNYTGTAKTTFTIIPKGTKISKIKKAKRGFTVNWKKQAERMPDSRITGYQIRCSRKSNMSAAKTITVKGYKKVSKKISKLKAKKKYYVQIRTYMKVDGTTYYSAWSKKKSVKIK